MYLLVGVRGYVRVDGDLNPTAVFILTFSDNNIFITLLRQCTCIFLWWIHSVTCPVHINVNFRWRVGHLTTRHLKFIFMWPWQVTLWIHQGNMHVQYSNSVINILRITKTQMQSRYRQESRWTRPPGWINGSLALVLVYSCTRVQLYEFMRERRGIWNPPGRSTP